MNFSLGGLIFFFSYVVSDTRGLHPAGIFYCMVYSIPCLLQKLHRNTAILEI